MEIRFSRHAKNRLRLYKLNQENVIEAINSGEKLNQGAKFESKYDNLKVIWVMIGSYAFVITVFKTR